MRRRAASLLVCAVLAVSAAAWAFWAPARPAPAPRGGAGPVTSPGAAPPTPAALTPGAGPTAADEGEIAPAFGAPAAIGQTAGRRSRADRRLVRTPPSTPKLPAAPHPTPRTDAALRTAAAPVPVPLPTSPPQPSATGIAGPAPSAADGSAAPSASSASDGAGSSGAPAGTAAAGSARAGSAAGQGAGASGASSVPPAPVPPPRAPVLVPPRVIATAGTAYPGDAFRLTVRRQDLGTAAVVEGSEGVVAIRAFVLATGDVRGVEVTASSGSEALDRAAVDAVRAWRFAPATRDGAPIDAYVTVRIRYVVR